MRIAFMGTPAFAVAALDALVAAGHELAAVYCQPPRPAGRGKGLHPSPVQARAEALGIPVHTPLTLRAAEAQAAFAALDLDVAVVAAYGLILPPPILAAPRQGCLNIHASLLPRWRGAAPIQRAILAGDEVTGVTIMRMEAGLDTGPMLLNRETVIGEKDAGALAKELAAIGAEAIVTTLAQLGTIPEIRQPKDGVTYASKIDKGEARLDFALPADQISRVVRAFSPRPGAFFEYLGERIRILSAIVVEQSGSPGVVLDNALTIACGSGAIRALRVQRSGKAAMSAEELLRGFRIPAGTQL
jgi:methionyl-tRNA formyltransferase